MVAAAVIGGAVISGGASYIGSKEQKKAAKKAGQAQQQAAQTASDTQMEMFDKTRALLQPYVDAGTGSLEQQKDLLGINGPEKQAAAIDAIKQGPEFAALQQSGEESILQNAAATGGLRGGNTEEALARFRPQLLAQLIQQRFGQLGDITGIGQASAAGTANLGARTGENVSNLITQAGQAQAGTQLAQGQAGAQFANTIGGTISNLAMLSALKVF